MDARTFFALLVVPIALILPVDAGAVTCDGPATSGAAGTPDVLTGCGDASVGELAPALGLERADLERVDTTPTLSGHVVRFQQLVGDVPVLNGQVAATYDRAGRLDMVQASTIPEPDLSVTPTISANDALAAAGFGGGRAQLVVYPGDGSPILAWHVERATATADLNAIVDAGDGSVVRSWDAIFSATADTKVFDPNPVQVSGLTTLADGNDIDTGADAHATTRTLDLLDSATTIAGDYAADLNPLAAPGDTSRSIMGGPSNFESATIYYAITEAQKKIQALGFTNVNNRTQDYNVNADPQDNSNYNSLTTDLTFGSGGVDDGEDAEVVLHEYGHSIQDNQVPGFGSGNEQGAMGEGFGDFFAAMITLEKGDGTYQASRRYCVADWDAVSYNPVTGTTDGSGCLRWIDGTDQGTGEDIGAYSGTPEEVHDDGRYWSAGMTCIFEGLGGNLAARDKVLKLVLDSQFGLDPIDDDTAFEKHIAAMIVSDQNLNGGANAGLIQTCADERGLLAASRSPDTTPPQVTATVNPPAPDGADGFYTGNVTVTWTVTDAESTPTTSGCEPVTISSDTGDAGTTLTCTATSAGGVTSKSVTIKRRAATVDAKAPQTTIGKHPRKSTRRHRARFQFKSSEEASTFECSLDGGRFSNCKSPKKVRVKTGDHTFEVRAADAAGNVEKQPASFTWTVKPKRKRR